MKTKDAFALRNFDEQRILSRPFFKKLNLPDLDDEENLETFDVTTLESSVSMEKRLEQLHELYSTALNFNRLILRHRERLKRLMKNFAQKKLESRYERAAGLWLKYNWFSEVTELFCLKFGRLFQHGEQAIQTQFRKEFATRLKEARRAAGLTQLELALKLKSVTANGYGSWEQGRTEPSIAMIIRLCHELHISADKLLGICA